jgi:hypothetical protein
MIRSSHAQREATSNVSLNLPWRHYERGKVYMKIAQRPSVAVYVQLARPGVTARDDQESLQSFIPTLSYDC